MHVASGLVFRSTEAAVAVLQGRVPDYNDPVVIKGGSTVEDFCLRIHKSFVKQFKHALVWGSSVKHRPQKVCSKTPRLHGFRVKPALHTCAAGNNRASGTVALMWC